ncbi:MAG: hypothetical protein HYS12_19380 [Planctomycetes bacterium]|nr:hypothetical protein [Planctomycetota bacterium]
MLAWLTRTRKRPTRRLAPTARLGVEELESRYCPAAPVVTLTGLQELANHQVQLSGHVTDESPTTVVVSFGDHAGGLTVPNSNGDYSFTSTATGLGTITATGLDNEGLTSNTATATFSSAVPAITLTYTWQANQVVHVSGHVTDEFNSGLTVTFSGAASGNTTTDSNGDFSTNLTATQLGTLNANVSDQWSQAAQAASVTLTNSAPVIQDFTGTDLGSGLWQFTGRVVDEAAAGLVVRFSGLFTATTTVNADGTFSLTVNLGSQTGEVDCQVTDWWNVDSAMVAWFI